MVLPVAHTVAFDRHRLWNSVFFSTICLFRESDLVHGIVLILPAHILPSFFKKMSSFIMILIFSLHILLRPIKILTFEKNLGQAI